MAKVRTTFRPDEEIEVTASEAEALKSRGLLAASKTKEYVGAGRPADEEKPATGGSSTGQPTG